MVTPTILRRDSPGVVGRPAARSSNRSWRAECEDLRRPRPTSARRGIRGIASGTAPRRGDDAAPAPSATQAAPSCSRPIQGCRDAARAGGRRAVPVDEPPPRAGAEGTDEGRVEGAREAARRRAKSRGRSCEAEGRRRSGRARRKTRQGRREARKGARDPRSGSRQEERRARAQEGGRGRRRREGARRGGRTAQAGQAAYQAEMEKAKGDKKVTQGRLGAAVNTRRQ